ncbi:MAG TPA: metallophosphoesterase [Verrucomicrobiae bacterium]|nr:metallophosphoesterase [Verrucomicrobiae bacterium]
MRRRATVFLLAAWMAGAAAKIILPLKPDSVRFAVIGDSGTGGAAQREVALQMEECRKSFPFDFVLMLGDNIYGHKTPEDYLRKFEEPYQGLLAAGVKFYASLGNHDDPNSKAYKPFNMDGKKYYSFKKGGVLFLALDSNYMDPAQLNWLKSELHSSNATWKICFFHHPLYSHGKMHGSDLDLRKLLEPIFQEQGVAVVFSGHEHVYERIKPQKGIYYFVVGNSGELRVHNLRHSPDTAAGFDTDRAFLLVEIDGNSLYFQAISRTGETIDSGELAAPQHSGSTVAAR